MFIELTSQSGGNRKELININAIKIIGGEESFTIMEMVDGKVLYFNESYDEVKQLIADEVDAERGY